MSQTISGTYTSGVTLSGNPATIATSTSISGTASYASGVYGPNGTAWTLTNQGLVSETGAHDYGISFAASGTIINTGSGTIAGARAGIGLTAGGAVTNQSGGSISGNEGIYAGNAATLVNAGTIAGSSDGIDLKAGGSVTNQSGGVISGKYGIYGAGSATVMNAGTIAGSSDAVKFAAGFANRLVIDPDALFSGTVTGGNTIGASNVSTLELASAGSVGTLAGLGTQFVDFAQVTVDAGARWTLQATDTINAGVTLANAGTLSGPVTMAAGGVLSNASTGTVTVSSGEAVYGRTGGAATVVNAGVIIDTETSAGDGTDMAAGGSVTNQSSGTISGYNGIYGKNAAVTVVNAGSIAVSATGLNNGTGVRLMAGGSVTNQSGGVISGWKGIYGKAAVTVVNSGSITGDDDPYSGGSGVVLEAGGSVTNQSSGVIGGRYAIRGYNAAVTVVNAGNIAGYSASVDLLAGGSVTNQSSGTITAKFGINIIGTGAVLNAGVIVGSDESGLYMDGDSTITNEAGGYISGYFGFDAIVLRGSATVVNAGGIADSNGDAIYLLSGGSVTNQSGGSISGFDGIVDDGEAGAATVVNAGIISGNRYAVKFAAGYANRLVIDPTAAFYGTVTGGNTIGATYVSTLELASAVSAGTLSGLGTQFIDFAQVTVDAGAQWTLQATDTIESGVTLTSAGSLSSTVTLAAGGVLSNASTGTVTASGGTAVYGMAGGAATVVNAGVIAGYVPLTGDGIDLGGGGSVTNQSSGSISGYNGIFAEGSAATVVNAGTIAGYNAAGDGIRLDAGGSVTNQSGGTISGSAYAVKFTAGYTGLLGIDPSAVFIGTVSGGNTVGATAVSTLELVSGTSAGTLTGLGSRYIDFANIAIDSGANWTLTADTIGAGYAITDGGTLTNAGSIGSEVTLGAGAVLTNASGAIIDGGTSGGVGVYLAAGGSVTNQSGGTIRGTYGIVGGGAAATVVNAGSIASDDIGVYLRAGGSITNQSGGSIIGESEGIFGQTTAVTVVNAGTVEGAGSTGIQLDGGSVTNQSGGSIIGGDFGINGVALTVVNAGSIAGSSAIGILLDGGSITNQSGGSITGVNGIYDGGAALTVVNAGSIAGSTGTGVALNGDGSVTNQSGGSITGGNVGISGSASTVVNAGSIIAGHTGVQLGGGSVTNQSGGSISGEEYGISGGSVTVINAGSIAGSASIGIQVDGGSVTNQSGGSISGGLVGIGGNGAAVTVVDAGTITGSSYAVQFAAGFANWLVVDPGAVFSGTVTGGNTIGATAVSTLELASAGSAGTLSGIATQYLDFAQTTIDSGAYWTLTGSNTFAAGTTLTDAGTLAIAAGTTVINDGTLAIAAGGTLLNAGGIARGAYQGHGADLGTGASVTNQSSGTINGTFGLYGYGAAVTVVNAGTIIADVTGVSLHAGGNVTNQSGGTITGVSGVYGYGAALTLVNAGSIAGSSGGTSVGLNDGGSVTNESSGSITGGDVGIEGVRAAVTVVNAGSIIAGNTGVGLNGGGSVTNQSGGLITGEADGISGPAVTVVNAGSIAGYASTGIRLDGGSVTNQSGGAISGGFTGIEGYGAAVTVVNAGAITGSNYAVQFQAGFANWLVVDPDAVFSGTVSGGNTIGVTYVSTLELASRASAGTLSGLGTQYIGFAQVTIDTGAQWTLTGANTLAAGYILTDAGTLTNAGTLSGYGVLTLVPGGVLSNASTGTITASDGTAVYGTSGGTATVVNAGVIAGSVAPSGDGIDLTGGGSVTNQSGGSISGFYGIRGLLGALTVVNAGTIAGILGDGVLLDAGGSVANQSGGTISGYSGIVAVTSPATVVNAGYIAATGSPLNAYGVYLGEGGTVTNLTTGTISGGIVSEHAPAAVVNYGLVANEVAGVFLVYGGSITNQAGGTISGGEGIVAFGAATVDNAGSIIALGSGVDLGAGGSVTNQSGGTITGTGYGVNIFDANATVDNLGYIDSSDGFGVYLADGGVVTNGAGGGTASPAYISGYHGGVGFGSANAGTLTNYGTISLSANTGVQMNIGTVVNGPSGATGALIAAGGGDGVLIKNTGTVVNDGQIESNGQGQYYGVKLGGAGIISNLGTASLIEGSVGVYAQLDDTVTNAGTIASRYGTAGIALAFGGGTSRLIIDPGATFSGTVSGGGPVTVTTTSGAYTIGTANGVGTTTLELASGASAGTIAGLGSSIVNFSSLVFDSGAQWTVQGNDSASGLGTIAITGFTYGDTIDLTGFVAVSETFSSNNLFLTDAGGAQETLAIQGDFATGGFGLSGDGTGTDITVICFAAGTLIDTQSGEVAVEKLKIGDLVMTLHNGPRPVKWIGQGNVLSTPNRRTAATPVIVRKGALGPNLPHQDLRVTKAHSLYIDEVLIPVEFLVNYKTIIWDDRAQEVEIYHVELESHDVLIANGVPAESYRDDGNRWLFQNANSGWDLPPQAPYTPVLTGGPVVDAVWERLLDRAGRDDLPALTEEADLHLIVDGVRVDARGQTNGAHIFRLPCHPKSVVIGSRAGVPAELRFARDPRCLGVALRRVTIRQGAKFMLVDADDERLTAGFHAYEPAETIRWTDGSAELPIEAFARFDAGAEVAVHLGGATRYPDVDRRNIAAAA